MEFVLDNVVGTCYFARTQDNLEKFVYFSTMKYLMHQMVLSIRNDRYNSTNPYSATKAGAEELAVAYENTYKLPIIITQ